MDRPGNHRGRDLIGRDNPRLVCGPCDRRAAEARREEQVNDFQSALLAEITSNLEHFGGLNLEDHARAILQRFKEKGDSYTPFVPRDASTIVFEAILPDLHILPAKVIRPVVIYYKTAMMLGHFVSDLETDAYSKLAAETKREMYLEYLGIIKKSMREAAEACAALQRSLEMDDQ